jgi:uncharacterized membrane protein
LRVAEPSRTSNRLSHRLGVGFVFLWFALGGVGHFVFTDAVASIVPAFVPFPRFWVLLTGAFEIAGACALLMGPGWRSAAGLALVALTICVTPANVEMLLHAERYRVGAPLLWARLAFQPILIWIIWRSTRRSPPDGQMTRAGEPPK